MKMSFEEFEAVPNRTLSESQERRLNRFHCCGDFGGGKFSTVKSLISKGYIQQDDKQVSITEKGVHYIYHHGPTMPV